MISFLFWNIGKNDRVAASVGRIAAASSVDLILLAECPDSLSGCLTALNSSGTGPYHEVSAPERPKVRVLSRLAAGSLTAQFTNSSRDMTIWRLQANDPQTVLLAAVHLPSKAGGVTEADQITWAQFLAQDVARIEDLEGARDTILVGDLNMNPFEPGVVSVMGLHGLMTRELARQPDRRHRGREFRRFYNRMWGLFGDRTPGPPGTFYWDASVPSNHHWHILDQVLLRPSLMDRWRNVQVLGGDGQRSFLRDGVVSKDDLSDHLPLLFQLDI
jgi:endonuclease/exonuclease/phosphatase family metal-dependent hydrolase